MARAASFRTGAALATIGATAAVGCSLVIGEDFDGYSPLPDGSAAASDAGAEDAKPSSDGGDASVALDAAGDADASAPRALWMFVASKPNDRAEVLLADPRADAGAMIVGNAIFNTNDAVAYSSGQRAFLLNRSKGTIYALDRDRPDDVNRAGSLETSDSDAAAYSSNPYAVTMVSASKGYVVRYGSPRVWIVAVASSPAGTTLQKSGELDLSSYIGPQDDDANIELAAAAFDGAGTVYFAAQRLRRSSSCPDGSIVVPVDSATDKPRTAIPLQVGNPFQIVHDEAGARMLVVGPGCGTGDGGTFAGGIDAVPLDGGPATSLVKNVSGLTALLYLDSSHAYAFVGTSWKQWNPSQPSLSGTVDTIPYVPLPDVTYGVVGLRLSSDAGDAGPRDWSIWSVDRSGQFSKSQQTGAFQTVFVADPYLLSSAYVR